MRTTEQFQTEDEDEKEAHDQLYKKIIKDKKLDGVTQSYTIIHELVFYKDKTKPVHRYYARKKQ